MTADEANFRWRGGAVRLAARIEDKHAHAREWGRLEKDEHTVPFGPWSLEYGAVPNVSAGEWVWRYGDADNGTGARYSALATKVHPDVADRLGGPIVVALLTPWTDTYAFAADGYLDPSYVADKLFRNRVVHHSDLDAVTRLVRILLGRTDG